MVVGRGGGSITLEAKPSWPWYKKGGGVLCGESLMWARRGREADVAKCKGKVAAGLTYDGATCYYIPLALPPLGALMCQLPHEE